MSVDHSAMRLGKRAAKHNDKIPYLGSYTQDLPTPPKSVDWSGGMAFWGVMENDRLGDCTAAGVAHAIQTWTLNAKKNAFTAPDLAVEGFYSQTCGYRPDDPRTDQGGVESDVLEWWHKNDFNGHTLDAFAFLRPGNAIEIRDAIWLMGGAYLGLALPITAQTQDIWDVANVTPGSVPGSWGGHCVWAVGYDETHITVVTWGQLKKMTWAFYDAYCDEAYALLSKDWIEADGINCPSGFTWAALVDDMQKLIGKPEETAPMDATADQNISITLSPHGVVVSISETCIKLVIAAAGAWLAHRTGMDASDAQTWVGGLVSALAGGSLVHGIHEANKLTKQLAKVRAS